VILTNQELRSVEREAERLVHEAGAFRFIEELLESTQKREGRPRGLPVKALFVGMQILSFVGDNFLRDVPKVLNGLSADLRKRFGIHGTTITSRRVTYLVSRIDAVLRTNFTDEVMSEDERYENFDAVLSAVAVSGAHAEVNYSRSISVDGSDIATWASARFTHKLLVDADTGELKWTTVKKNTDTDAGRRAAGVVDGKPALFGYELTAVSVADVGGPDVPRTTLAARFRPTAQSDPRSAALACIEEVALRRGQLGDVLVDRAYAQSKHGKDFRTPNCARRSSPGSRAPTIDVAASGLTPSLTIPAPTANPRQWVRRRRRRDQSLAHRGARRAIMLPRRRHIRSSRGSQTPN
jgi:hypothetical protein